MEKCNVIKHGTRKVLYGVFWFKKNPDEQKCVVEVLFEKIIKLLHLEIPLYVILVSKRASQAIRIEKKKIGIIYDYSLPCIIS